MSKLNKLWVEKYRPNNLKEFIFQDVSHYRAFTRMIEDEESIPHLLFSGNAGSGKTTLSKIIVHEFTFSHILDETDVLTINASDENSVDVIREKIKSFILTAGMGDFKIVQLEEADYITPNGQAVLRQLMEEYADFVRFILTCNYEHKIIPAIRSRCQHFKFQSFDKDDIAERIAEILIEEDVRFDLELLDKYINTGYPDIRKIINTLQQNSHEGVLHPPKEVETGDYKFKILELLSHDKWFDIRKLLCQNVSSGEWEDVYRFFYENLDKSEKFSDHSKWEKGIVIIADHLHKHSFVADSEINFTACVIRLSQL